MERAAQVLTHLQTFTVSGCPRITDKYLERIIRSNPGLSVLGFSRCAGVRLQTFTSSNGLQILQSLQTVDFSHNANIGDGVVGELAKHCRLLTSLCLQYCLFITDVGVQRLAVEVNHESFTSLDLSGCVRVSDYSISVLGQLCRNLRRLNLKAVNRVTEEGVASVTHNCWALEFLCLGDIYNLRDSAFIFNSIDGRRSVEANMLRSITVMNLEDCNKITDMAVDHIMKRVDLIETLNLGACCRLTDAACDSIARDSVTGLRRGTKLTSLNLAFCLNITDEGIALLATSLTRLRCVNLAGCVQLTDNGVLTLVSTCTRLQELALAHCKNLSDLCLCHIADFLWVEYLDISYCNMISDDGIEVIAIESIGLHRIILTRCSRLTDRTLDVLSTYCPHLKWVELHGVSNFTQEAIDRLRGINAGISVFA